MGLEVGREELVHPDVGNMYEFSVSLVSFSK